jgi:hypothetical protein
VVGLVCCPNAGSAITIDKISATNMQFFILGSSRVRSIGHASRNGRSGAAQAKSKPKARISVDLKPRNILHPFCPNSATLSHTWLAGSTDSENPTASLRTDSGSDSVHSRSTSTNVVDIEQLEIPCSAPDHGVQDQEVVRKSIHDAGGTRK